MSSIEKRLRDELGELASWLIDRRAESGSVEQADSGIDSIPRDSGADSIPRLDLDADTVRSGGRGRLFRVAAVLLLIVGLVGVSGLLSEDAPSVVTVPADPASQTPTTSAPTTSVPPTTTVDDTETDDVDDSTTVDGTATDDVDDSTTVDGTATDDVDDSTTVDDQLDESSGEQIVSEVELDVPPRGVLYESSTRAEEWLVGPFQGGMFGEWHDSPWLFPWGDGFLQIGFSNTEENFPAEINLFAQTSDDGLNWGQPFQLNLPRQHFETIRTNYHSEVVLSWPIIRSNGEHLVVLSQSPGRHLGDGGARDDLSRRSAPVSARTELRAFISVTDDLEDWDSHEYPLLPPDGIHDSLSTDIVVEDVIVSNDGWMIRISTLTYINIGLLIPANIRESVRWEGPYEDGMLVEWTVEETNSESIVSHERLFSWEELGTTLDLFFEYGVLTNKGVHPNSRFSGSVLVAKWGEGAVRGELPSVDGICCQIIATDAGYVGLSIVSGSGYSPFPSYPGDLVFSPDGLTWHFMESPADEGIQKPNCVSLMWTPSIYAVEGGVVLHGREQHGTSGEDCEFSLLGLDLIWVGDDRGSNWKLQEISEDPFHRAAAAIRTTGRGVLLHSAITIHYPEFYDHLYQSTIVSADGINWVSFDEPHPRLSPVAFNGNVALQIDSAGNAYRYELQ